jgi:hypothetical protein
MRICLVLGAGATLANAQRFRSERGLDTHPPLDTTFFQKIQARDVPIPPALRSYMRRLLGVDPTPSALRGLRMEEFFKDIYYDFQSAPTNHSARHAYIELVTIYTRVLRETTNWLCEDGREGAPVGRLIAAAADVADQVDVVTFNHDIVIENEIFKRARLRARWCLEKGYGDIGENMTILRSGTGADFPRHSDECDHTRPIRVLKLHGSLNWVVRMQGRNPTAKQLTGSAATQDVLMSRRREIIARLRYTRPKGKGRGTWHTWPLIIPPIYAKQSLIQTVQAAWAEARQSLEASDRVVFYGYSLPPADIEAEKLFARGLASNSNLSRVDVVNPDPDSSARYARLLRKQALGWYPGVDLFLATGPFAQPPS